MSGTARRPGDTPQQIREDPAWRRPAHEKGAEIAMHRRYRIVGAGRGRGPDTKINSLVAALAERPTNAATLSQ